MKYEEERRSRSYSDNLSLGGSTLTGMQALLKDEENLAKSRREKRENLRLAGADTMKSPGSLSPYTKAVSKLETSMSTPLQTRPSDELSPSPSSSPYTKAVNKLEASINTPVQGTPGYPGSAKVESLSPFTRAMNTGNSTVNTPLPSSPPIHSKLNEWTEGTYTPPVTISPSASPSSRYNYSNYRKASY